MKRFLFILLFCVATLFFFKDFFVKGLLPIPADTIVGLYHPFRDLLVSQFPRGVPFKNFLITDPVRQQYPWRYLAISLEKQLQLPLWNPYNFSGSPLLANFQSAVFYPLNILFFFLPFATAWSALIILEPLLGGLFMFFYLKSLRLSTASVFVGAITFAFSGFFVAWMEWGTILHIAIWLPLLLLSLDRIFFLFIDQKNQIARIKYQKFLWCFIFLFSLLASFFAGHLQIFFYVALITLAYFSARWVQSNKSKKIFLIFLILASCFLILTAIQWIPAFRFISLSARNVDVESWKTLGWFIPWQNSLQFIFPDFFGNPTTLNYWGVWNYGEFIGYVGIAPLLFALFALFFRHDKKTFFFGTLFFLSSLFAFPTIFAKLPFIFSFSFLDTAQPTRLLFVADFSLAILAALGFDYFFKTRKKEMMYPLGFLFFVFFATWMVVFLDNKIHIISSENLLIAKHNIVLPTILFVLVGIISLGSIFMQKDKKNFLFVFSLLLIFITVFDLLRFTQKFETFSDTHYLFPDTKVISFLQKQPGIFRIMTTDSRILPPNFSIIYSMQSVDGYDPLYLRSYGEFIAASERGKPDIEPPFGFNRIITPHTIASPLINLLNVKYILSLSDLHDPSLKKVFQEGETRVYENAIVLPRAYLIAKIITVENKQAAMNMLFNRHFNQSKQAVVTFNGSVHFPELDGTGAVHIISYMPNKVVLQTNATGESFLVLGDINYPTWHATVDTQETPILPTDYLLRGIAVPKGKHTIVFYDSLF